jgi:hypothetical protein
MPMQDFIGVTSGDDHDYYEYDALMHFDANHADDAYKS